eukprot:TRINITY_DN8971_c0_g1_i4.p1 TRINITY_DN8971_c0_g1~~TRINITY_DN8971_c0_g1_i4.p1  ORF type:complete len:187 (-),score=39.70 TRINITY_DN8971_c0_g1_i4:65-625(-)
MYFVILFFLKLIDSAASYPTILQVVQHYNSRAITRRDQLRLVIHMVSLPFHINSWKANCALHGLAAVEGPNSDAVFDWLKIVYDNMDGFSGPATENMTSIEIREAFEDLATRNNASTAIITQGLTSMDIEQVTRAAFRYWVGRDISHTPTFFLNGRKLSATSTTTLSGWKKIIDPYVRNHVNAIVE